MGGRIWPGSIIPGTWFLFHPVQFVCVFLWLVTIIVAYVCSGGWRGRPLAQDQSDLCPKESGHIWFCYLLVTELPSHTLLVNKLDRDMFRVSVSMFHVYICACDV